MIDKGVNPKDFIRQRTIKSNPYGILKWALLLVGLGLGVFIGSLMASYTTLEEVSAYFATTLFFGGLGLVAAYLLTKKADNQE